MDAQKYLPIKRHTTLLTRLPETRFASQLAKSKANWIVFGEYLSPQSFDDIDFFTGTYNTILDTWKVGHYEVALMSGNLTPAHEEILQALKLDYACLSEVPDLSKPGLIVMDMDSTAIQIECIDEMAVLAGVGEEVANVTAQAMRGELDFAQSLIRRVAALEGAGENIVTDLLDTIPLMPGLSHLVRSLKAHQWKVVIASGGFLPFTEHLQQMLGLDATFANDLEIIDGKLTGKVNGEIVDAQKKADVVLAVAEQAGIPRQQTVAMGDGANDLIMMDTAGLGVAFHAKPLVQSKAKTSISHGGLDQLLYLLES